MKKQSGATYRKLRALRGRIIQYRMLTNYLGYLIGDDGSVWSCWERTGIGVTWGMGLTWKKLKPGKNSDGYLCVQLTDNNRVRRTCNIAVLVLTAFVGPCPPGMEACHFPDGNRKWATHKENERHKIMHGTQARSKGSLDGQAKIHETDIPTIRARHAAGDTQRAIAQDLGVDRSTIGRILRGERWSHV